MSEPDLYKQGLSHWLELIQNRTQRLLDLDNAMDPDQRVRELLDMSNQLLKMSRTFLDMGEKISHAAASMMPSPGDKPTAS